MHSLLLFARLRVRPSDKLGFTQKLPHILLPHIHALCRPSDKLGFTRSALQVGLAASVWVMQLAPALNPCQLFGCAAGVSLGVQCHSVQPLRAAVACCRCCRACGRAGRGGGEQVHHPTLRPGPAQLHLSPSLLLPNGHQTAAAQRPLNCCPHLPACVCAAGGPLPGDPGGDQGREHDRGRQGKLLLVCLVLCCDAGRAVIKRENTTADVKVLARDLLAVCMQRNELAAMRPIFAHLQKLPKKPAPARFGRKLTAVQKARATHLCIDCGYVSVLPCCCFQCVCTG